MARGMSGYIDTLFNHTMGNTLKEMFPINVGFLADYPDFFSFFMVILLSILLAIGVKESTTMNNIMTAVNLLVIGIVLVIGVIKGNCHVVCNLLFSSQNSN